MSSEILHERLTEVLLYYGVSVDLSVGSLDLHDVASYHPFIARLSGYVGACHKANSPVEMDLVLTLICEFMALLKVKIKWSDDETVGDDVATGVENEDFLLELISLLPQTKPNNTAVCKLIDILRTSTRLQQREHARHILKMESPSASAVSNWSQGFEPTLIPVRFHPHILATIHKCLVHDNPKHILFPGDKQSSLQTSSVPIDLRYGFTVAMWIKFNDPPAKEFTLFRGKSPNGDILVMSMTSLPDGAGQFDVEISTRDSRGRGQVCISYSQWHFITVVFQDAVNRSDSISIAVDGVEQFKASLRFFREEEIQTTIWTIGQGFSGSLASFCVYLKILPERSRELIYEFGPYITDIHQGVYHAQTSSDSGYNTLSTVQLEDVDLTLRLKKCRLAVTPLLASLDQSMNNLPERTGNAHRLFTKMVGNTALDGSHYGDAAVVIVNLNGKCSVNMQSSWMEAIMEAGGMDLLLYLFWQYSVLRVEEEEILEKEDDTNSKELVVFDIDNVVDTVLVRDCLGCCLTIMSEMMRRHIEAKEQFIQMHGFHVLSSCMDSWSTNCVQRIIDTSFIDVLFRFARSLGKELGYVGDSLASLLQGLLFDFRIWSALDLETLCYYLDKMTSLCNGVSEGLMKFIGVQRILDIMRINLSKALSVNNAFAIQCANEFQSLLTIIYEQALKDAHNQAMVELNIANLRLANGSVNRSTMDSNSLPVAMIATETEILLRCLEETNNSLIAESVCRILYVIRSTSPASLRKVLLRNRYWDTVVVNICTKKGLSLEVREHSLANLLWLLSMELRSVPVDILKHLRDLNEAYNTAEAAKCNGIGGIKLRSLVSQQMQQVKQSLSSIEGLKKGCSFAWKSLMNLSAIIKASIRDGSWGINTVTRLGCFSFPDHSANASDFSNAFHSLLAAVVAEAKADVWLLLPVLPPLATMLSNDSLQFFLAHINVQLKTEDCQNNMLGLMDESNWMDILVELLLIGCAADTSDITTVSPLTLATTYGTAAELALDTLCSILALKMRLSIEEEKCATMWDNLEESLKRMAALVFPDDSKTQQSFIRYSMFRVVQLVLQRLIKLTNDQWSISLVHNCVPLVKMIHQQLLTTPSSSPASPLIDLLGEDEIAPQSMPFDLNHDSDIQLMRHLIPLSQSIRHFVCNQSCDGSEWRVLKRVFLMILSTNMIFSSTDEMTAGMIAREIEQHIKLSSLELNARATKVNNRPQRAKSPVVAGTFPYNAAEFKKMTMDTVFAMLDCIRAWPVLSPSRKLLIGTLEQLLIFFRTQSVSNLAEGYVMAPVVQEVALTLGKLADSDLELVYKVLSAEWKDSVISFKDDLLDSVASSERTLPTTTAVKSAEDDLLMLGDDYEKVENTSTSSSALVTSDLLDLDLLDLGLAAVGMDGLIDSSVVHQLTSNLETQPAESDNNGLHVENPFAAPETKNDSELTPASTAVVKASTVGEQPVVNNGEKSTQNWLKIRMGISSDRIDTERARMTNAMSLQDVNLGTTQQFWRKARRKIELESFQQSQKCHWKLGIAHEGPFFGRKRIILRPRFENLYAARTFASAMVDTLNELEAAATLELDANGGVDDVLQRALVNECSGYIRDVTRLETELSDPILNGLEQVVAGEESKEADKEARKDELAALAAPPGTSWGVVGADGSEEGFGVVGLATASSAASESPLDQQMDADKAIKDSSKASTKSSPAIVTKKNDIANDLHLLEAKQKLKTKIYETGPCPVGAFRDNPASVKLENRVVLITASGNCWGQLSLSTEELFFCTTAEADEAHKEDSAAVNVSSEQKIRQRRWKIANISAIYLRRYRLRDSALEVFFKKGKHRSVFVDFGHTKEDLKKRLEFVRVLISVAPNSAFKQHPNMTPFKLVFDHGVQEKWLAGKLSNFDYLMALNTIAGRSFNDLCQYPVMPWILNDYESSTIDLNDPECYRDLSKPVGALNEARLKEFLDRFHTFEENISGGIPAFMYGSHYSTMVGVVLHFLVRLQPFAALHQEMQNGHFDVPDRLFSSIPRSFLHNTTQLSEVKEITPEWFTTPEMFRNVNRFDFGCTQDGENVDDVELPPWASSPEEFVRINRAALESDFVSEHLHEWIDLIFGYKQRGPESVSAHNVFYYLTYYGAVDHYMIQDEAIRKATELQIAHFGQTPMQLFRTPHPAKRVKGPNATVVNTSRPFSRSLSAFKVYHKQSRVGNGKSSSATRRPLSDITQEIDAVADDERLIYESPTTLVVRKTERAVVQLMVYTDRILCVLDNGVLEILKYETSDQAQSALATASALRVAANASPQSSTAMSTGAGSTSTLRRNTLTSAEEGRQSSTQPVSSTSIVRSSTESLHQIVPELQPGESLLTIEKEYAHFDVVPKMPLPSKVSRVVLNASQSCPRAFQLKHFERIAKLAPGSVNITASGAEIQSSFVTFNRSNKLCLSFGRADGIVSVRELDSKTGGIKSSGDFCAHRNRVISAYSDTCSSDYDVVASLDESGSLFLWTIVHPKPGDESRDYFVISRRPQKTFRCQPSFDMSCTVSCNMGVAIVLSGNLVYIFSIERNELLRSFKICYASPKAESHAESIDAIRIDDQSHQTWSHLHNQQGNAYNGPIEHVFGYKKYGLYSNDTTSHTSRQEQFHVTRRHVLSDFGYVVIHVESFVPEESILEFEDHLINQHFLITHSLSGQQTGMIQSLSPISALVCPDRGDVVISGHRDGSVVFYQVQNLSMLYRFEPSLFCVQYNLALPGFKGTGPSSNASLRTGRSSSGHTHPAHYDVAAQTGDSSAIIAIAVGPNRQAPSVIVLSTEAGNIYVQALPDFIRWERSRTPSALAQLASVPLQAVKGTLMQAQNWTAETAGVLAQNAKLFADDALTELKKMKRSSIVKGVANFFGVKNTNQDS